MVAGTTDPKVAFGFAQYPTGESHTPVKSSESWVYIFTSERYFPLAANVGPEFADVAKEVTFSKVHGAQILAAVKIAVSNTPLDAYLNQPDNPLGEIIDKVEEGRGARFSPQVKILDIVWNEKANERLRQQVSEKCPWLKEKAFVIEPGYLTKTQKELLSTERFTISQIRHLSELRSQALLHGVVTLEEANGLDLKIIRERLQLPLKIP